MKDKLGRQIRLRLLLAWFSCVVLLGASLVVTAGSAQAQERLPVAEVTASDFQDPNVPENTLDGDLSAASRWSAEGDQWIRYDLGNTFVVESVSIAWVHGDQRVAFFDIEVSQDDTSWTQAFSGQSSGMTAGFESFDVTDTSGRYVRIFGHGNSQSDWNSIAEVEIFGSEEPPPPAGELAVVGVTASSDDGHVPENTIDDDLSPESRWSAQGDGEWIRYDLGDVFTFNSVAIAWHQGDQRTAFFDVQASLDDQTWTTVLGGAESSGTTLGLECYNVWPTDLRYVRIVGHGNSANDWNSITEVKLYDSPDCSMPPDTEPPTAPTGLAGDAPTGSRVDLSWGPSSDNVGVAGYRIYRDGSPIDTTGGTSYSDTTVSPETSYTYTVTAFDADDNESSPSNQVNVTTPPSGGGGVPVKAACKNAGSGSNGTSTRTNFPHDATTGPEVGGFNEDNMEPSGVSGKWTITQDGTVINGIYHNGNIEVNADNVTIRNSIICGTGSPHIIRSNGQNLLIENSIIRGELGKSINPNTGEPCASNVAFGNYTIRRSELTNCADGVKLGSSVQIYDSWFHDAYANRFGGGSGTHNDTAQKNDNTALSSVVFEGNAAYGDPCTSNRHFQMKNLQNVSVMISENFFYGLHGIFNSGGESFGNTGQISNNTYAGSLTQGPFSDGQGSGHMQPGLYTGSGIPSRPGNVFESGEPAPTDGKADPYTCLSG